MSKLTDFEKWYCKQLKGPTPPYVSSDIIWQYFHQEFPQESFEIVLSKMLTHFEDDKKEIPEVRWANVINNALHECEILWNGDQKADALGLLGRSVTENASGYLVCPTCEGSRRGHQCDDGFKSVRISACCFNRVTVPCPDCKPKCEHQGNTSPAGSYHTKEPKLPYCNDCCSYFDQRKVERRNGWGIRSIDTDKSYDDWSSGGRRITPKGDRRKTKTLTGSLKGMRPQND